MLWRVPLIQMVPLGARIWRHSPNELLLLGDTFELLKKLRPGTVDLIFADPPYFLSNDGITWWGASPAASPPAG